MARSPKIIILSEQLRGQSFELTEPRYTLGRAEDCDICIPDPTMSSHHSTLVQSNGQNYIIEDNGSTNGTRVNGVRVESQELTNSDIIQVGAVEILYDSAEKSVTSMLSTQTGINLSETAGDLTLEEMNNFSPFETSAEVGTESENRIVSWLISGGIGVLVLAALFVLALLVMKLLA